MWGCFLRRHLEGCQLYVFPTHVGVFPSWSSSRSRASCLPHACGGVSISYAFYNCTKLSSPRMWGCFFLFPTRSSLARVFPTHVGVFLYAIDDSQSLMGLPHACGGVSLGELADRVQIASSPRMWGCFYINSFYYIRTAGLPHACGGVSPFPPNAPHGKESSPRMWGCFLTQGVYRWLSSVFPTHVGVFLSPSTRKTVPSCLPHACGGVSR